MNIKDVPFNWNEVPCCVLSYVQHGIKVWVNEESFATIYEWLHEHYRLLLPIYAMYEISSRDIYRKQFLFTGNLFDAWNFFARYLLEADSPKINIEFTENSYVKEW